MLVVGSSPEDGPSGWVGKSICKGSKLSGMSNGSRISLMIGLRSLCKEYLVECGEEITEVMVFGFLMG